jgi:phosphoglycerate dehydrogenase-like enzyme
MHLAQADAAMKAGRWERNKWVGVSMVGKTLAIMGFGKVGSEVARRAKGERLGAQLMLVSAATCLYTLGFLFILLRLEGWM